MTMKIASKIDKRTFTKLSKKNFKCLTQEIESQCSDLLLEASWLRDDWDPDNKYMEDAAEDHKETIASWHKDIKAEFRAFKSDTKKLIAAHAKFNAAKK